MDDRAPAPRVLLAEDDPVSARFLGEALAVLGARVEVVADGPAALAAASGGRFDLLLLDLGLPGLDGAAVLRALRARPGAASRDVRAVATSAGPAPAATLAAAGFDGLLRKPATVAAIGDVLRRAAPAVAEDRDPPPPPVLDDAAALAALGAIDAVVDLRRLLAAELPSQVDALRAAVATGDLAGARGVLHRLQASTRFCGAAALADAATRLQRALDDDAAGAAAAASIEALGAAAAAYAAALTR